MRPKVYNFTLKISLVLKTLSFLVILLFVVTDTAYSQKNMQNRKALAIQSIQNSSYFINEESKFVKLKNGIYEYHKNEYHLIVELPQEYISFGDFDFDGDQDAVGVLVSTGGGSGRYYDIVLIENDNGKPKHVYSENIDDRAIIKFLKFLSDGTILLDAVIHRESDSMCCPTLGIIRIYKPFRGLFDWRFRKIYENFYNYEDY